MLSRKMLTLQTFLCSGPIARSRRSRRRARGPCCCHSAVAPSDCVRTCARACLEQGRGRIARSPWRAIVQCVCARLSCVCAPWCRSPHTAACLGRYGPHLCRHGHPPSGHGGASCGMGSVGRCAPLCLAEQPEHHHGLPTSLSPYVAVLSPQSLQAALAAASMGWALSPDERDPGHISMT